MVCAFQLDHNIQSTEFPLGEPLSCTQALCEHEETGYRVREPHVRTLAAEDL